MITKPPVSFLTNKVAVTNSISGSNNGIICASTGKVPSESVSGLVSKVCTMIDNEKKMNTSIHGTS
jgi:hypothetical protein